MIWRGPQLMVLSGAIWGRLWRASDWLAGGCVEACDGSSGSLTNSLNTRASRLHRLCRFICFRSFALGFVFLCGLCAPWVVVPFMSFFSLLIFCTVLAHVTSATFFPFLSLLWSRGFACESSLYSWYYSFYLVSLCVVGEGCYRYLFCHYFRYLVLSPSPAHLS